MPATMRGNRPDPFVIGVDGCRKGWVVARVNLYDNAVVVCVAHCIQDVLDGPGTMAAMIIVDMPIGLSENEPRACEMLARRLLGRPRSSSVFSSPRRPMLGFDEYSAANTWGKAQRAGGGLSKQAWNITPKIREVDEAINAAHQSRLGEGHPEIAFYRLNGGAPCAHSKRTIEGAKERADLLRRHGIINADTLYQKLKETHGAGCAQDDVFDALALALTAKARLECNAIHLTNGDCDARGLKMEIWG